MSDLILWGVPLTGLIVALMKLAADLGLPPGAAKHVQGLLFALGYIFITALPDLESTYPLLAQYGPLVLGAVVAYLIASGYYEIQSQIRRAMKRATQVIRWA